MSGNAMLDRLDADIKELEKDQFAGQLDEDGNLIEGKQEKEEVEEVVVDEVIVDDDEVITDPELEVDDPISDLEVEAEDLDEGSEEELEEEAIVEDKPKRKSWKSEAARIQSEYDDLEFRYNNLRAATDQDKHQSRTKIASLLSENGELETQVTELRSQLAAVNANTDIYADIFTDEDVVELGEEAIDAFKRASKKSIEAAVAPLKSEIEATRLQNIKIKKAEAEVERKEAYEAFRRGVKDLVPEFDTLNTDADFIQYMEGVEPGGNKARKEELNDAVITGNIRWAATFFNNYKALRAAPKKKLDDKLMPKSSTASTVETKDLGKKKTYPLAEYTRFMDKLTRGDYNKSQKERELSERLEAMYDKAFAEGRIV